MTRTIGLNEMRMRRVIAISMALTTMIVPAVFLTVFDHSVVLVADWWTPVSVALVVGAAPVLIAASLEKSGRWIGPAALLLAVANVIGTVLWLGAWNGEALPPWYGTPPIWLANTVVLPAFALVTVYRASVSMAYLAIVLLLLSTAQQLSKEGHHGILGYTNGLLTASLVGVLLTAEVAVIGAVRKSDRRREEVLARTARAAVHAARTAERDRLDVVVRDEVIAVLRTIGQGVESSRYRATAAGALANLSGRTGPATVPHELSAADTVLRLREAVNGLGDDTLVDIQLMNPAARYPYPLTEAIADAAVEAVTNVIQHAGPAASRALIGAFDDDLIRLRIVDDGSGFDPRRVPADRAGIELGIIARLREQPGGGAWVDSAAGEGAMVSIEWSRP
ncbi:sensor histidine kinase [Gordonia sp. (in: high G+C Gram-positive bacteria)]|uniref:sensor histidine kinase n=1 Tax=Gordonia sp. (in: high G+C Gram-positive bacteria) TaxID=84139 RepID=UPI003C720012